MIEKEFRALPFLLGERDVIAATGYARNTLRKYVDNCVLEAIKPAGAGQVRYRKRQIAQLLGLEELLDVGAFRAEPLLMPEKQVMSWTGYGRETLALMVAARSLAVIRPAGSGAARYQKRQIAQLIGYPELI